METEPLVKDSKTEETDKTPSENPKQALGVIDLNNSKLMMIVDPDKHQISKSRCKCSTPCPSTSHWMISEKNDRSKLPTIIGLVSGFILGTALHLFVW